MQALARARLALGHGTTLGTLMGELAQVHGNRRLMSDQSGGQLTYRQAAKRVNRWAAGIAAKAGAGRPGGDQHHQQLRAVPAVPGRVAGRVHPRPGQRPDAGRGGGPRGGRRRRRPGGAQRAPGRPPRAPGPGRARRRPTTWPPSSTPPAPPAAPRAPSCRTGPWSDRPPPGRCGPRRCTATRPSSASPSPTSWASRCWWAWPACGVPVHVLPKFRPVEVLDAIEQRRATLFIGVPAMYRMLLEAGAPDRDLTSVRVWGSGADAMPADLARQFKKMGATATIPLIGPVGEATFLEGYGMVEVGGGVAAKVSPPLVDFGLGDGLGVQLPGYHFRVVDEDDQQVRPGESGELWVRGPGVDPRLLERAGGQRAHRDRRRLAAHRRPGATRAVRHGGVRRSPEGRDQARRLLRVRPRGAGGAGAPPLGARGGRARPARPDQGRDPGGRRAPGRRGRPRPAGPGGLGRTST